MAEYLYGILRGSEPECFGPIGIGATLVRAVVHEGIAALVGSAPPPLARDAVTREGLMPLWAAHQAVLERISETHTVVPIKFGTTVPDDGGVRSVLTAGREQFQAALEKAEGKVEIDVLALWADLEAQLRRLAQENGLRMVVDKVELGRRLQALLRKRSETMKGELLRSLGLQAEDRRLHESADDLMIMHAAFWLRRDSQAGFNERFSELDAYYGKDIHLRKIGPLPPHSFLVAEVKSIDPRMLSEALRLFDLGKDAAPMEVQDRYRELAQRNHPDRNPGDPAVGPHFENIVRAYDILLDYSRRRGPLRVVMAP